MKDKGKKERKVTPKLQILMPGKMAILLVGMEMSGGRTGWEENGSNITEWEVRSTPRH